MPEMDILKENLMKFFTKPRLRIVCSVLKQREIYSLRVVEWFINNYAKKHNVSYNIGKKTFNVYASYKNEQMKSFSKKQFDLFRRSNKFTIKVDEKDSFETTIAQLNFFKWAIENKVLNYVQEHVNDIRDDMTAAIKKPKTPTKTKVFDNVYIHKNKVIITFD